MLQHSHDEPSAGHQGRTLHRLQQESYWAGMTADVECYCRECLKCQQMKPPKPSKAPLTSHGQPIGQPWEMIAVDVLQVPMSLQSYKHPCHYNPTSTHVITIQQVPLSCTRLFYSVGRGHTNARPNGFTHFS